jgi:CheY-like chemotaxis protein
VTLMHKLTIPANNKVLLVEDSAERIEAFVERIRGIRIATSERDAINFLMNESFDLIFLDFDLSHMALTESGDVRPVMGSGLGVAEFLRDKGERGDRVVLHSHSKSGVFSMSEVLPAARVLPWGSFLITVK